jgi:NAD(P)-dependent dehydrogenase (short-subunit alcohol dehydrogenase family)
VLAGIERVEVGELDLLDPASIDAFAARYLDSGRPLHMLLNNAGIMGGPLVRDARGYESQFATNHLGHFQLTLRLLPALRAARGARVVNTTSGATRVDRQRSVRRRAGPPLGRGPDPRVRRAPRHHRRHQPGQPMPADQVRVMQQATGLVDESGQPVIGPDRGEKTRNRVPPPSCSRRPARCSPTSRAAGNATFTADLDLGAGQDRVDPRRATGAPES